MGVDRKCHSSAFFTLGLGFLCVVAQRFIVSTDLFSESKFLELCLFAPNCQAIFRLSLLYNIDNLSVATFQYKYGNLAGYGGPNIPEFGGNR